MEIKLLKKGIKVDGEYYPCWYSSSKNSSLAQIQATIYIKTYDSLPEELKREMEVVNNSDIQTDYFEKDRIRIPAGSKYFNLVESLARK